MTDEFTIQGEKFYAYWLPNGFCNLRLDLEAEELQQPVILPYQGRLQQLTPEQVNEFLRQMEMFNQNLRVAAETVVREQAQIQQARQALERLPTTPESLGAIALPAPDASQKKKPGDNARLQAFIQSLEDENE